MTFILRIFLARSDGEVFEKGKGTLHDTYIEIGILLIQCISIIFHISLHIVLLLS